MKTFISINKKLIAAISPIIPIAHLKLPEQPEQSENYALFNIPVRQPSMLQAGTNERIRVYGYIDVFTVADPSTSTSVLDEMDQALTGAGFSVMNIATVAYLEELEKYHSEIEWSIGVDASA